MEFLNASVRKKMPSFNLEDKKKNIIAIKVLILKLLICEYNLLKT